jgi:uncharacterized protein with PQ loop repeat
MFHIHLTQLRENKVDDIAYVAALIGNIATVPQIITVWSGPSTGVSLASWLMYIMVGVAWLFYGLKNKQRPLVFAQILGISMSTLVVMGVLLNHQT